MGADIAKVEPPRDDSGRTGFGDAFYFMMYNANKRSLTVNLKDERGLAMIKEMVKKADVFTENFAPGAVERLGLRYDVVGDINPSIIYPQVKGFGDGSPFSRRSPDAPSRCPRACRPIAPR
jgi:formyl-CoA transferase